MSSIGTLQPTASLDPLREHPTGMQTSMATTTATTVQQPPPAPPPTTWASDPDSPEAKVGIRVEMEFKSGESEVCRGTVEAYSPTRQEHFVLFDSPNPEYEIEDQPAFGMSVALVVRFSFLSSLFL